jgi:hypothetical protein
MEKNGEKETYPQKRESFSNLSFAFPAVGQTERERERDER